MTNIDITTSALRQNKRLTLNYGGHRRTVEVHAIGCSKKGQTVIRVWQTGGGSVSEKYIGWKLIDLEKASDIAMVDEVSEAPRASYKKGDRAMAVTIAEL